MMVGHPGETMEDVRASLRIMARLESFYRVGTAVPFPGTALHGLARRKGWLRTADWSEYVTHHAHPVSRTADFTAPEVFRLTCLVRRAGDLFAALAQDRRRARGVRSVLSGAWRLSRLLSDRFGAPYQDDLTVAARARVVEAFLAKDAEPARFEELLAGLGLDDLERLRLPSARSLDELVQGLPRGCRLLVAPGTGIGPVLPLLRRLCAAEQTGEVGVACSDLAAATLDLPGVAHPKLRHARRPGGDVAAAIRANSDGWDAFVVPCLSFEPAYYGRLVLRLLVGRPTRRPIHVVALGTGGNVIEVSISAILSELCRRAAARANALVFDRVRAAPEAFRLARLARRWHGSS
jgi:hypothetical protein